MLDINQESDMTMTVDEALDAIQQRLGILRAEVERLRAEQNLDGAEIERLQKVIADQALTVGTLKDELGATTEALSHERDCSTGLADELGRSEKEAQTARLALDVATKEVEVLRAKARWDEERWPTWDEACRILMTEHGPETAVYHAARVLLDRVVELENPPPGAAT